MTETIGNRVYERAIAPRTAQRHDDKVVVPPVKRNRPIVVSSDKDEDAVAPSYRPDCGGAPVRSTSQKKVPPTKKAPSTTASRPFKRSKFVLDVDVSSAGPPVDPSRDGQRDDASASSVVAGHCLGCFRDQTDIDTHILTAMHAPCRKVKLYRPIVDGKLLEERRAWLGDGVSLANTSHAGTAPLTISAEGHHPCRR